MADEPDTPDPDEKASESTAANVEHRDQRDDVDEVVDFDETDDVEETGEDESQSKSRLARWRHRVVRRRLSRVGSALVASAVVVATLTGLAGWLGYRAYEEHEARAQRDLFVQVARQGAANLTTINYTEGDADVPL